ncbi:MAG: hypothetical protein LAN37_02595 [Acidobacteriia bacterium]|nr:hypothetical protein [Terriglobia bacterium]
MTWSNFYLICFIVGFTLSLLSFLAGALNLHLPGLGHHHIHIHLPHLDHGHLHLPHIHMDGGAGPAGAGLHAESGGISPFNFSSMMAFLAWFGGAGYLLTTVWHVWAVMALGLSLLSGVTGAMVVFLFLAKVLMRGDYTLHDSDYDVIGLLANVTSGIRAGGTGEIVYSLEGTRQTCGARSEDGNAIEKGTEVVITGYSKGIASVRRWDEMAQDAGVTDTEAKSKSSSDF